VKNQPFIVANQYNENEILQNGFAGLLFFDWDKKSSKRNPGRLGWLTPANQRSTFFFVGEGQRKKYQKRKTTPSLLKSSWRPLHFPVWESCFRFRFPAGWSTCDLFRCPVNDV